MQKCKRKGDREEEREGDKDKQRRQKESRDRARSQHDMNATINKAHTLRLSAEQWLIHVKKTSNKRTDRQKDTYRDHAKDIHTVTMGIADKGLDTEYSPALSAAK